MAAMPPSRNAPASLSMREVTHETSAEHDSAAHAGPGISEQEAGMWLTVISQCMPEYAAMLPCAHFLLTVCQVACALYTSRGNRAGDPSRALTINGSSQTTVQLVWEYSLHACAGPCTDMHIKCVDKQQSQTTRHMTPELGESIRRDLRGRSSGDSLSEREDMDGLDQEGSDSDSDSDDGWLSEDGGKLGLAKSKVSFGHITPPRRES